MVETHSKGKDYKSESVEKLKLSKINKKIFEELMPEFFRDYLEYL
jgi:hypothetical protein